MVACPERELYTHVDSRTHKGDHSMWQRKTDTVHHQRVLAVTCVCVLFQSRHSSPGHGGRGKRETLLGTHSAVHLWPFRLSLARQGHRQAALPHGESESTPLQAGCTQLPAGVAPANRRRLGNISKYGASVERHTEARVYLNSCWAPPVTT